MNEFQPERTRETESAPPPTPSLIEEVKGQVARIISGQNEEIEQLLTAFAAGGHVLLEGVPGVAKTLAARCLASALELSFSRVQFTPDLMPSDITGVNVYEPATGGFHFKKGPIFADIVLADEINRAPAKTQAALLEAMQEKQVTIDGVTHPLSTCFTVIATQNPLEYEGTYPLPEAQLDRFLMNVRVTYPSAEEELIMLRNMNALAGKAQEPSSVISPVADRVRVEDLRNRIHGVEVDETIFNYVVEIIRSSRELAAVSVGASPRAAVMLLWAAKSLSLLRGNAFVRPDEVRDAALPVLRHRLSLTPEAQIEGLTPDQVITELLKKVAVPR